MSFGVIVRLLGVINFAVTIFLAIVSMDFAGRYIDQQIFTIIADVFIGIVAFIWIVLTGILFKFLRKIPL